MVIINLPRYALLTLGFLFTFAYCWVFDKGFRLLFAPLMLRVAGIGFGGVAGHLGAHPFGFLKTIVENVERWAANGMQASERGITYSISQLIDTVGLFFGVPLAIALVTYEGFSALGQRMGQIETAALGKVGGALKHWVTAAIAGAIAYERKRIARLLHDVKAAVHHTAVALPRAKAQTNDWFGRTARQIRRMNRRLGKLEKLTIGAVTGGLVIAKLSKKGFGCFFGNNGRMIGKRLCRVDSDFLDALLLGGLFVSSAVSVVEFAEDLEAIEHEVIGILSRMIKEFPSVQEAAQLNGPTFPH